jgi:hypothetical protein
MVYHSFHGKKLSHRDTLFPIIEQKETFSTNPIPNLHPQRQLYKGKREKLFFAVNNCYQGCQVLSVFDRFRDIFLLPTKENICS